jgi:hypothetical protein
MKPKFDHVTEQVTVPRVVSKPVTVVNKFTVTHPALVQEQITLQRPKVEFANTVVTRNVTVKVRGCRSSAFVTLLLCAAGCAAHTALH